MTDNVLHDAKLTNGGGMSTFLWRLYHTFAIADYLPSSNTNDAKVKGTTAIDFKTTRPGERQTREINGSGLVRFFLHSHMSESF